MGAAARQAGCTVWLCYSGAAELVSETRQRRQAAALGLVKQRSLAKKKIRAIADERRLTAAIEPYNPYSPQKAAPKVRLGDTVTSAWCSRRGAPGPGERARGCSVGAKWPTLPDKPPSSLVKLTKPGRRGKSPDKPSQANRHKQGLQAHHLRRPSPTRRAPTSAAFEF